MCEALRQQAGGGGAEEFRGFVVMAALGLLLSSNSMSLGTGAGHFDEYAGLAAHRNLRGPNLSRLAGQPCSSSSCSGQDVGQARCSFEDYSSLSKDGPKEPTLPKFNRLPYDSTAIAKVIEVTDADASLQASGGGQRRRRRGRPYQKVTPAEVSRCAGFSG